MNIAKLFVFATSRLFTIAMPTLGSHPLRGHHPGLGGTLRGPDSKTDGGEMTSLGGHAE